MYTFAVILHLIVCFLMIAAILLQAGKGAEIGAAFGGSSQTVFGSRGPGTFLSKVTVGAAIIFMLTSLGLAILSKGGGGASSVIDLPKEQGAPTFICYIFPTSWDLGVAFLLNFLPNH
jgi:preprotein translocase subunit SecG